MASRPIGVFDSGIGGLTVLAELLKDFPSERFIYVGDTARVPYGAKSQETVLEYSKQITDFLLKQKVKMIVAACNTASALAVPTLKKKIPVPLLGVVEATAQAAALASPRGPIGVIATKATIASSVYSKELKKYAPQAKVLAQACPLFVPLVEEGWFDHPVTRQVVKIYLEKMMKGRPQALILGCTHYPMLKKVIADIVGGTVLVDSPRAVAQTVLKELDRVGRATGKHVHTQFYATDDAEGFKRSAKLFFGKNIPGPVKIVRF